MARTKISEFSATPASNTDIDSIFIGEGMAPSNVNDAIRELMAQLKDFQTGAVGDSFNGPVGSTTAATGAFTTLTTTGTINNLTVGRGAGAVATNTAVGASALAANTTGGFNTAIGSGAGATNTTGTNNLFVGRFAGNASTGNNNTFVGDAAAYQNTSGGANTAVGQQALQANTTASNSTAVGYQAGYANTTGRLTAFGASALLANTTGYANIAVGLQALFSNTTGNSNVAIGSSNQIDTGSALSANTTGGNNVAIGTGALNANTTASGNVAIGYQAGYSQTTGGTYASNTFVGDTAGLNSTGDINTFVGAGAGRLITTGSRNTIVGGYIGNQGGLDIRTANGYIVLSDGNGNPWAWRNASYSWTINSTQTASELAFAISGVGKASIYWDNTAARLYTYTNTNGPYVANGGTSWTNSSDERLKNITGEIQNGLSKVCALRAAEYTWKSDETAKPQVGLIAQDVLAVLPEAVEAPEDGTVDKDGNPAMMGVQYTNVIPLLVAAIKELKSEVDATKAELAALKGA